MKKIKVLLTGASGTVGYQALLQLVAQEELFKITVFDMDTPQSRTLLEPFRDRVRLVYGDITQPNHSVEACRGVDYVIHLASLIPPMADENQVLAHRVNVEGTRNLISNLERYSPDVFVVYSSSVSVYGDRVETPEIRVSDPLKPSDRDYYATTKIAAEEILRSSRLRWSIFRLSAIIGAQNHKISPLMFHMPLNTPIEMTSPEDTARAFVHAAQHREELEGKIFNLGGGEQNRIHFRDLLVNNFRLFGLGKFNLPEKAFAEKNFHCGYYADGDDLERIVHFRQDTLAAYWQKVKESVPRWRYFLTRLVAPLIKKILLFRSEPWQAYQTGNKKEMKHYFRSF
ncbi:NAD-binding protein [Porphyromonas gingivicanis]|uniref:NAD-binding protein n=1 Tax=Porphyromonas gingivicanis TaxID=266762 RepID=A0A0A2GFF4_9PORP|nr:NAD(P)-dependent oxidoreductase [Porphyromonas gingivicanis]KGN99209.1 NAD-binding protein [Porphyromonas gingivicanis]